MHSFSIRNIESLTGIKAHTLRIWEQRYRVLEPSRRKSQHRVYNNEDLKKILKIAYLYHRGYKISVLAGMDESELNRLALTYETRGDYTVFVNQLMEASLDFDEERFAKTLNDVMLHLGFESGVYLVLFPFLNKIGLLWMLNHMLPAQEHFASNLIRMKLIANIDKLPPVSMESPRRILIFTPEGEAHEIPILLVQYLLKKSRTRTVYFGTEIPLSDIRYYLANKHATHLYFHILTFLKETDLESYLLECLAIFEEQIIVVSGPMVHTINYSHPRLRILRSLQDIIMFAQETGA